MALKVPDSFFPEQGSTQEEAERTEPEPVYLSQDSDAEEEKAAFTSGAPGFASLTSFVESAYIQNPNFQSRNSEIATMKTVVDPEEDRKLSSSPTSSQHDSDSDYEEESETELDKTPKPKSVKLVSKALRVKRNIEHGRYKTIKKAKKGDLWDYSEQILVQVLQTPTDSFVLEVL